VNSLYGNVNLALDPVGSANILNSLLAAYGPQRAAAAQTFVTSAEYRKLIVTQDYKLYLKRSPNDFEIAYWQGQFQAGVTREQEIANLMGSSSFFNNVAPGVAGFAGPGTFTTFVQAAYKLLFPYYTVSTGEVNLWVNQLQAGTISTQGVALALDTSNRYLFRIQDATDGLVNKLYNQFLVRNVTTGEDNFWAQMYAGGARDEDVITNLVASPSYFTRTHPFP
jgi:hypothetical protein